jgi:hypothetical protein
VFLAPSPTCSLHPRINPLEHHVRAEIHQQIRQPDCEQTPLHQGVIAVRNRVLSPSVP